MTQASAQAPGKVILFGEHAINRGQPAIAAAVGLHARCDLKEASHFLFRAQDQFQQAAREEILELRATVDQMRTAQDFEAIRALSRQDYFAPQKYILAKAFGNNLPAGLEIDWQSEIPSSSGLGSGGAAYTAMVTALCSLMNPQPSLLKRAEWAQLGDIVAHGGVASGLDTQTSLLGGVIHFTGKDLAQRTACAEGACLIVANSGIVAATSEVNSRVRLWLAEKPNSRIQYFHTIGALTRSAMPLLQHGDWDEIGNLMNLNQLVLEKIGVSCPQIDRLIEAALKAGAYGAKISGSGGGGIIIALSPPERKEFVIASLKSAGATVIVPAFAVDGARCLEAPPTTSDSKPLSS